MMAYGAARRGGREGVMGLGGHFCKPRARTGEICGWGSHGSARKPLLLCGVKTASSFIRRRLGVFNSACPTVLPRSKSDHRLACL